MSDIYGRLEAVASSAAHAERARINQQVDTRAAQRELERRAEEAARRAGRAASDAEVRVNTARNAIQDVRREHKVRLDATLVGIDRMLAAARGRLAGRVAESAHLLSGPEVVGGDRFVGLALDALATEHAEAIRDRLGEAAERLATTGNLSSIGGEALRAATGRANGHLGDAERHRQEARDHAATAAQARTLVIRGGKGAEDAAAKAEQAATAAELALRAAGHEAAKVRAALTVGELEEAA